MPQQKFKLEWIVWGLLGSVVLVITALFISSRINSAQALPKLRSLPEFTLTNQFGKAVSKSSLRGTVWLANIIFTRCPGPCPKLTKQFAQLQETLPKNKRSKLVTLTADPEFDSPAVLNAYAQRAGAEPATWEFLTGPKSEIYQLALDGLMLAVQEKSAQEQTSKDDLFIHSTLFVLVDGKGNVRAFYESTKPGIEAQIRADIEKLLKK